jgi:hypothetical protein
MHYSAEFTQDAKTLASHARNLFPGWPELGSGLRAIMASMPDGQVHLKYDVSKASQTSDQTFVKLEVTVVSPPQQPEQVK